MAARWGRIGDTEWGMVVLGWPRMDARAGKKMGKACFGLAPSTTGILATTAVAAYVRQKLQLGAQAHIKGAAVGVEGARPVLVLGVHLDGLVGEGERIKGKGQLLGQFDIDRGSQRGHAVDVLAGAPVHARLVGRAVVVGQARAEAGIFVV